MGGDEIAILLPGASAAEAAPRAETVIALIRRMAPIWEGNALTLTASAGVAVFPEHAGGAADLFLAADLAMHQAKRRGGGRVRLHDPSDRERDRTGRLREQSNRIRSSLAESRFVPYFQPVAEVGTGRIVAVETLARMREPDGRIALPAEFLGAAERFGIVTAIDRAIIAAAFDNLAAARKRISPELEIGINLSGLDFDDDTLVADISRMARAKGIRPERVTFEITETAALRDFDRVQDFTRALIGEGFHFALDDFGMGFSSFRYLRELPVSTLKLDISYVRDLPKEKANRVFVRGMAGICRGPRRQDRGRGRGIGGSHGPPARARRGPRPGVARGLSVSGPPGRRSRGRREPDPAAEAAALIRPARGPAGRAWGLAVDALLLVVLGALVAGVVGLAQRWEAPIRPAVEIDSQAVGAAPATRSSRSRAGSRRTSCLSRSRSSTGRSPRTAGAPRK